jgi:hypothetical protein
MSTTMSSHLFSWLLFLFLQKSVFCAFICSLLHLSESLQVNERIFVEKELDDARNFYSTIALKKKLTL